MKSFIQFINQFHLHEQSVGRNDGLMRTLDIMRHRKNPRAPTSSPSWVTSGPSSQTWQWRWHRGRVQYREIREDGTFGDWTFVGNDYTVPPGVHGGVWSFGDPPTTFVLVGSNKTGYHWQAVPSAGGLGSTIRFVVVDGVYYPVVISPSGQPDTNSVLGHWGGVGGIFLNGHWHEVFPNGGDGRPLVIGYVYRNGAWVPGWDPRIQWLLDHELISQSDFDNYWQQIHGLTSGPAVGSTRSPQTLTPQNATRTSRS